MNDLPQTSNLLMWGPIFVDPRPFPMKRQHGYKKSPSPYFVFLCKWVGRARRPDRYRQISPWHVVLKQADCARSISLARPMAPGPFDTPRLAYVQFSEDG
eukprot:TRINITY_DN15965_c1_g1_i1.p1 TRINITY_DN15965_c1_g1~~TRINITY_DN15965_c1_g1_i1.p1  ORF type:complete len:100 (+),score=6.88 TRINITY_DN15965_c1_g1_i1:1127-1426(+)